MPDVDDETLSRRPRRNERVLGRATGDTFVLLDMDSGGYFSLEGVASSIWGLCDGELTIGEIADRIASEYEVSPDAARTDVLSFVDDLAGEKLLLL